MKRVSIIIPVYNSERYIAKTLQTIMNQTYSEIEVIMIDDGSSDHSDIICKGIAESDSRFHYFRVENGGPSTARNIGLSYATGEYIGFCDSDDIISPNMYECLVRYAENTEADIVLCDIYSERDKRNFGLPWSDGTIFEKKEIRENLFARMVGNCSDNDNEVPIWGSVVRCLFKRSIIVDNEIEFPSDIHFAEDLIFTLRYLKSADKAVICNQVLYQYTYNEDSIMNSFFSYKVGMFAARKRLILYIREAIGEEDTVHEMLARLRTTSRCYFRECVGNACRNGADRSAVIKRRELVEILDDEMVKSAFRHFDANDKKTKLIYLMIRWRWAFAIQMYYYFRFKD